MKKIFFILCIAVGIYSCKNFEVEHPDFDYTSGFFPYQFPVRILVLGDYIYDNSNDNAKKFLISVAMGGVYENKTDRSFTFEVDESLCNSIYFVSKGDQIKALPKSYYTLSSSNTIVIPKGKMNGGVEVQLTDAFFNDPLAIKNTYVVPLKLKSSNDVDTILMGSSSNKSADPRIASQWTVAPKNFTMFAVKYINEFHGNYFHYGSAKIKDAAGAEIEAVPYNTQPYVENNPVALLTTTGRYQVTMTTAYKGTKMAGNYTILLTFNGNNCTITAPAGSAYTATGTGMFVSKKYSWGNKQRDGIELSYKVTSGTNTFEATEVLVARDRAVVMEVYNPSL
jgi:hypothetical protein